LAFATPRRHGTITIQLKGSNMKHPIDPKVDCVFKALLGTQENANLLISFNNLKTAIESPKSAQPLGAPSAAKNGSSPIR